MSDEWNKKTRRWENSEDQKKLFSEIPKKENIPEKSKEEHEEKRKNKQTVQRKFG